MGTYPASLLRQGLRLSAGGIRVREYDDMTALLELNGPNLTVTRSDDHAATTAEMTLSEIPPECEGQLNLSLGLAGMLTPPTPAGSEPITSADGESYVDARLMERILTPAAAGETVEITHSGEAQTVATSQGSYHTLVPPPFKKLRTPDTLPFGSTRLGGIGQAYKNTAAFAGARKDETDHIVLTVTEDQQVWMSRGAGLGMLAGQKLEGNPPVSAGSRLLLRGELGGLLSQIEEGSLLTVSVDVHTGAIYGEIPARGWTVRYVSPPDLAGAEPPPRVEDWLNADENMGCVVSADVFAPAVASACAMAGYAPPTASTRDSSVTAIPFEGAADHKPEAKKLVKLSFHTDTRSMVVSSQGWRYDRTATEIGYQTPPAEGQIETCFGDETGEITAEPKLIAVAAAAAEPETQIRLSLRSVDNIEGLVVEPSNRCVFVMPVNPEMSDIS